MKDRLLTFIEALRDAGVAVTVAEELDAMHAIRAVGIERATFKEGLAATLVKDEAERPVFETVFERFFALPGRQRGRNDRPHPSREGRGRQSPSPDAQPGPLEQPHRPRNPAAPTLLEREHHRRQLTQAQRLAHERTLVRTPFAELSAADIEECGALVATLARQFRAHLSRRQQPTHRGRLDIRRTMRRAISLGGVPLDPAFRHRRPGRPDLIALCDFSYSVATASGFLVALLAPASAFFRRVRLFAFVDQPVEVSLENGLLVPHQALDLYARSDFGKVLRLFCETYEPLLNRNTIMLILGDARNNRRPARADLLGRIHRAVRQVTWLNPEARERWGTGDSALGAYEPHCDALIGAGTIRELSFALRQIFRTP